MPPARVPPGVGFAAGGSREVERNAQVPLPPARTYASNSVTNPAVLPACWNFTAEQTSSALPFSRRKHWNAFSRAVRAVPPWNMELFMERCTGAASKPRAFLLTASERVPLGTCMRDCLSPRACLGRAARATGRTEPHDIWLRFRRLHCFHLRSSTVIISRFVTFAIERGWYFLGALAAPRTTNRLGVL